MQLNVVHDEIPDDYSLLESGLGLDSILIAEFIFRIEDRFGLQLDDRVLDEGALTGCVDVNTTFSPGDFRDYYFRGDPNDRSASTWPIFGGNLARSI